MKGVEKNHFHVTLLPDPAALCAPAGLRREASKLPSTTETLFLVGSL